MRIAVDAMGGDHAPDCVVDGCLEALSMLPDVTLSLCGPEQTLTAMLKDRSYDAARLSLVDAPDVITNHDSPTLAVRRKTESSLVKAMDLVKAGEAQAAVSAGSTGAVLAGGIFRVGRIRGIHRPALAPVLPTMGQYPVMLVDCGANMDCKPDYLVQFALMGSAYMQGVMHVSSPRVGLLNVGAEDEKGNELSKNAFPLLQSCGVQFVGNVEARDALSGEVQVIVTDGFAGNILLKSTEGAAGFLFAQIKEGLTSSLRAKLGALLIKPALRGIKKKLDYQEYGGAALLGVDGAIIKAHGSSTGHAYACAIRQAYSCVQGRVAPVIAEKLLAVAKPNT